MKTVRASVVVALVAFLAAPAGAALCVKRSGAVVMRSTCKKKEAQLNADAFLGAQGPSGSQGPAGAKGDKGDKGEKGDPAGARLLDSTGKVIGIVDNYSDVGVVVPQVGILSLYVGPQGFVETGISIYHEGANCSDPAFVYDSSDGFDQYPDVKGTTAYFAGVPVEQHTFNSREFSTSNCTTGITPRGLCCSNYASPVTYPAGPLKTLDLSTLGTPPFTVQP